MDKRVDTFNWKKKSQVLEIKNEKLQFLCSLPLNYEISKIWIKSAGLVRFALFKNVLNFDPLSYSSNFFSSFSHMLKTLSDEVDWKKMVLTHRFVQYFPIEGINRLHNKLKNNQYRHSLNRYMLYHVKKLSNVVFPNLSYADLRGFHYYSCIVVCYYAILT